MTPSITACATWTPLGPNSRARDWARARKANLPVAKEEHRAEPLREAVAPVKMRVGGWVRGEVEGGLRRRGRVDWEKRKAPLLEV